MKYILLCLVVFVHSAYAAETESDSDIHRNKAKIFFDQKDFPNALQEARQATTLNPNSLDAWLIRATVAMRLEQNPEALDAFKKYLALNPPADKAAAVRQRVAELEVRAEKQKAAEDEAARAEAQAKAARFGVGGTGLFIGYSPFYKPSVGTPSDLNSTISSSFDLGIRFNVVDLGIRRGTGTIDKISVTDSNGSSLGTYTDGKHTLTELYMRWYFPVWSSASEDMQILIPAHAGGFFNNVQFTNNYWNMGFTLASGGQFRYYTGSHFTFDVSLLYNLSLPFSGIQNNETSIQTVNNATGNKVAGSTMGPELRLGTAFLF